MAKIDIDESKVEFKIDDEFAGYLFPLTDIEYEQLKKSIEREGCREPLIVWDEKNILVDGHHRLSICQELGKEYEIERKSFQFRAQIIAWIIINQFAQRNLNNQAKDFYLGELYKDEKKGVSNPEGINQYTQNGVKSELEPNQNTAELIAKEEGEIGPSAVKHNQDYSKAVNKVTKNIGKKFRKVAVFKEKMSKSATKKMPLLDKNTQEEVLDIIESSDKSFTKREIETLSNINNKRKKQVLERIKDKKSDDIDRALKKVKREEKRREFTKKAKKFDPSEGFNIYEGKFQEISKKFDDEAFNHIVTDPPYGKKYIDLWNDLGEVANRVLKPSGFLVAMSGQLTLPDALDALSKYLNYYWTLSYIVPDKSPVVPLWEKKIKAKWKPIVIFYKEPENKQFDTIEDIVHGSGNIKDKHEWEQPVDDTEKLIEMFTNPGDKILDPMAGSGTTLVATKNKERKCVGIEKQKKYIDVIKGRLV